MATATKAPGKNIGKVTQVIGSTFDVEYPENSIPAIYNAVRIDARNSRRRWPRAGSRACSLRRARPARQNKARIVAISVAATR